LWFRNRGIDETIDTEFALRVWVAQRLHRPAQASLPGFSAVVRSDPANQVRIVSIKPKSSALSERNFSTIAVFVSFVEQGKPRTYNIPRTRRGLRLAVWRTGESVGLVDRSSFTD